MALPIAGLQRQSRLLPSPTLREACLPPVTRSCLQAPPAAQCKQGKHVDQHIAVAMALVARCATRAAPGSKNPFLRVCSSHSALVSRQQGTPERYLPALQRCLLPQHTNGRAIRHRHVSFHFPLSAGASGGGAPVRPLELFQTAQRRAGQRCRTTCWTALQRS